MMNTRIYSKRGFEQEVNNAIALAYERRKPSVDFLLLFSVRETEKEQLLAIVKENPLILTAQWRFETVMMTAYIKT
ncbi:hypothetical protein [Streptococcus intermedius]|uniref:hypothetical protein n=1 Tax=Streptococcus intermedius TaxID=1338 RepID=UPI000F664194|nr:hypothetical protein [Streptococcus intermedius]